MKNAKISVLYLDDERNNLISFRANFRDLYEVYTASSVDEAKNILSAHDINVLITDQRMPDITGVQFLESIIKDHPFPVRIILTGYTDIETVMEAINKGQVYRYIMKPFDTDELKIIIDNAYDLYLFRRNSDDALSKYIHLYDKSGDAIFYTDDEGKFVELNEAGLNLFKIAKDDLKTVHLQALFVNPDEYRKIFARLLRREAVIDHPVKLRKLNNEVIDALFSFSQVAINGKLSACQGMIRDISKQKEIENLVIRTIIETQESERINFGKELHDGVGSRLVTIKNMLQGLAFQNEALKANPKMTAVYEALNAAIIEMRNICFNILPKSLETLGLCASVQELCLQNESGGEMACHFNVQEDFPKLNMQLEMAIFRIVQEFISNSIHHGKAREITLDFSYRNDTIYLILKDNGRGFNVNSFPVGAGLRNIRSRIQSYNGEMNIKSSSAGTEFIITLPVIDPVDEAVLN
jgi:PAS domain S-box-containing protein